MDLHKEESQKTLRCAYGTWPPACLAQTRAFPAKLLCVGLESGKNMQEAPLEAEAYFRSVLSDKSCKVVVSVTYKQKGYTIRASPRTKRGNTSYSRLPLTGSP